ncbi:MAG: hypothetical protein NVSMB52_12130 [Chloroflexota bacterium]
MQTMWTDTAQQPDGLSTIEAVFFTEHFVIRGAITTPETRLSDHLNSSTTTIEIQPSSMQHISTGQGVDSPLGYAYITKAHLLFIAPLQEPSPPTAPNISWARTCIHSCWAGIGRYSLTGKVHTEAERSTRLALRAQDQRQFLAFTGVALVKPDRGVSHYPTIIVNRHHLEVLVLTEDPSS